jgi:hypothetical protein
LGPVVFVPLSVVLSLQVDFLMNPRKLLVRFDINPVTSKKMMWAVRLVEEGDKYGLNMKLVKASGDPYVEFYDMRLELEDLGQFVSRYYRSTILEHGNEGLCLDGGVSDWNVSADTMMAVKKWLVEGLV